MREALRSAEHTRRWGTALAALAVLVACVLAGGIAFSLLCLIAALGCLWEYQGLTRGARRAGFLDPGSLLGYAAAVALAAAAHSGHEAAMLAVPTLHLVCCGALCLRRFPSDRSALEEAARQVLGVSYLALPLALFIALRAAPQGMVWVFLTCAVVFAGDSAAFYVGHLFGKRKLAPAISPGKTREGALGGLVASLLVGWGGTVIFLPEIPGAGGALLGGLVGLAGQAGDLFESCWKRAAGVKDSGALLPGHGGILDRLDALLFAAPVAFGLRLCLAPL
ncbi:MAG: phosphatidate cytidylyltransferase [Desulfobacterales bacterium]